MDIKQGLQKWGLNDKEAKIYDILVRLIELTVYQIAIETKIPRTS